MDGQPDDFEMVAASLRADDADTRTYVEVLATKLEGALPGHVQVERHARKLFSHDKVVRRIAIALGDCRYTLDADGTGSVDCSRAKAVRGIVLKNERLGLSDWVTALAQDIAAQAATSEEARIALQRLLT